MTYKIIGKYIKDIKFNIPNPKTFFLLSKDIANYKINIDIKSAQVSLRKFYFMGNYILITVKLYNSITIWIAYSIGK